MVFSYLDARNWQQQHNYGSGSENPELPSLPAPSHVGAGSIRPGLMADRARLAKIPQPEVGLKCPRCESTNTKFCYFNNYSLTQPRHFCKTCRRYWTRGGALRSVPIGGGCRRNKKNKSSTSKSTASSTEKQDGGSSSTNAAINPSEITARHLLQQTSHFPFMASLQSFPQFGLGNLGGANQAGTATIGFHIGTNSGMSSQQFPLFDPNTGLYCHEGMEGSSSMMGESQLLGSSSRVSQLAPVKSENNNQLGLNLSRSMMGVSENNQFWSGNNWTDLSGLNSSNTNYLL